VLAIVELARYIGRSDRALARFIDGLTAGDFERPVQAGGMAGLRGLTSAIDRAVTALGASRVARQRQIDALQSLIDNVAVALFVVDAQGSVTMANRAARQIAGCSISRLDQLGSRAVPASGRADSHRETTHASTEESVGSKLLMLAPGQRTIVRLANGQRVLASVARFTAPDVSSRLFSLQNIESELDAVELKAWRDLVRILAHEMMNSLTPIASLAQSVRPLLEADNQPLTQADDIASAIDAIARRSAGLMSFVERYRQVADLPRPVLRPVRLDDLTQRVDKLMNAMASLKGIAYSSRVEPSDLTVLADPDMLEQALINLIANAIDALSGIDHPRVEVLATLRGSQACISVSDNGPGVDPDAADRIFVPFFTTKPGGSGIGLSLTRQIAHAHGGRLEMVRNEPAGAIFTVLIPGAPTDAPAA
jgi:nitrogen fixation/metabolism regulation signal transduction histidine kinase